MRTMHLHFQAGGDEWHGLLGAQAQHLGLRFDETLLLGKVWGSRAVTQSNLPTGVMVC
jgi:hypothetical protein